MKCKNCNRTSSVVDLEKVCPFCRGKEVCNQDCACGLEREQMTRGFNHDSDCHLFRDDRCLHDHLWGTNHGSVCRKCGQLKPDLEEVLKPEPNTALTPLGELVQAIQIFRNLMSQDRCFAHCKTYQQEIQKLSDLANRIIKG